MPIQKGQEYVSFTLNIENRVIKLLAKLLQARFSKSYLEKVRTDLKYE